MNKYLLINLLKQGGYFMVNKHLIKKLGLTEASVLALLLDMNAQHGDDFFVTAETAKDILNLGRRPYDSAIASLKESGIITTYLKGAPPKTFFVINYELLASFLEDVQNGQINLYSKDNSICTNRSTNNNKDNNTPNTLFPLSDDKVNKDISPTSELYRFDEFWDAYDKKCGRDRAERAWKKLSKAEVDAAIAYIPSYKAAQPNKQYRKNPEAYINQRAWNDELIGGNDGIPPRPAKGNWVWSEESKKWIPVV